VEKERRQLGESSTSGVIDEIRGWGGDPLISTVHSLLMGCSRIHIRQIS
jgi:hypothetical protein